MFAATYLKFSDKNLLSVIKWLSKTLWLIGCPPLLLYSAFSAVSQSTPLMFLDGGERFFAKPPFVFRGMFDTCHLENMPVGELQKLLGRPAEMTLFIDDQPPTFVVVTLFNCRDILLFIVRNLS